MSSKIVAIVGSYRKGGTVDSAVETVLESARAMGAQTQTFYLRDEHIEFCTNCRKCMQDSGEERGKCVQQDALETILTAIEAADGVVLGAPVNCYNVTAVFRRFMERLVGFAYWHWGEFAPKLRTKRQPRRAVLIASAAIPGFAIPLATGAPRALRTAAQLLGAKTVGKMWIGLAARRPEAALSARARDRAERLGAVLAQAG